MVFGTCRLLHNPCCCRCCKTARFRKYRHHCDACGYSGPAISFSSFASLNWKLVGLEFLNYFHLSSKMRRGEIWSDVYSSGIVLDKDLQRPSFVVLFTAASELKVWRGWRTGFLAKFNHLIPMNNTCLSTTMTINHSSVISLYPRMEPPVSKWSSSQIHVTLSCWRVSWQIPDVLNRLLSLVGSWFLLTS